MLERVETSVGLQLTEGGHQLALERQVPFPKTNADRVALLDAGRPGDRPVISAGDLARHQCFADPDIEAAIGQALFQSFGGIDDARTQAHGAQLPAEGNAVEAAQTGVKANGLVFEIGQRFL